MEGLMEAKSLVDSLRRGRMHHSHLSKVPKNVSDYYESLAKKVEAAERFTMPMVNLDDELLASAAALAEADLFKLPYPLCYLELNFDAVTNVEIPKGGFISSEYERPKGTIGVGDDNTEQLRLTNSTEVSSTHTKVATLNHFVVLLVEQTKEGLLIVTPFNRDLPLRGKDAWRFYPTEVIVDPSMIGKKKTMPEAMASMPEQTVALLAHLFSDNLGEVDLKSIPDWSYLSDFYMPGASGSYFMSPHTFATSQILAWLVLLHTSWVEKRKLSYGGKEPYSRGRPINAHTRVVIEKYDTNPDNVGVGSEGSRAKVRLHLRRGHIRRQLYGPARSMTKKIWIEPVLVGYSSEGTITHDYEVNGALTR
jgi:hypothetical protein